MKANSQGDGASAPMTHCSSLTRRSFLKATAVGTGALAVTSGVGLSALAEEPTAGVSEGEEVFWGVCHPNCFGFCHLNVHVRDGRITKTTRAPYKNESYSRICQRGLSHVQRTYDPQRILYPLRRVEGTERGAGQWERISWDEAIADVASHMQSVQEQYGSTAVAICTQSTLSFSTTFTWTRFYMGFGCTTVGGSADNASKYAESRMTGGNTWESNERTDLSNAKTIVAWGCNATTAQHHIWHLIKEARDGGTKLVVIDPVYTQLASKADMWVPIRPGSDTSLLLAMCNRIFQDEAFDEDYVRNSTVGPFLVRQDNGKFLRLSDMEQGAVSAEGDAGTDDPYMVYDWDGALKTVGEASRPHLFASCTTDSGVACRTALALVKDNCSDMNFERASELTEIPLETIEELYGIFIDQPVTHMVGYGPQAYMNGLHTTLAGFTMNGLIGNLGYPGASYGSQWTMFTGFNKAYVASAGISSGASIGAIVLPDVLINQKFKGEDYPIKMMINALGNPLCCCPDANKWLQAVSNLDYMVTVESAMTDTAAYSDIVLPVAHWFEQEDIFPCGEIPVLNYSEKAIEPAGESKTDVEIVKLLAEAMGKGDLFFSSNAEVLAVMTDSDACKAIGANYDKLKESKEVRYYSDDPHIPFRNGKFNTPTGRLEIYVETPKPGDASSQVEISSDRARQEHMATWFPPANAWPENDIMKEYPLVCQSERNRFMVHSQWFSTPLLRELDPEPILKMNPEDAASRELEDGQYVEVYNNLGHAVARLVLSDALRPGLVVYPKGWQRSQFKAGSWSELISGDYDAYAVNGNFMDVVCEVRAWEEE